MATTATDNAKNTATRRIQDTQTINSKLLEKSKTNNSFFFLENHKLNFLVSFILRINTHKNYAPSVTSGGSYSSALSSNRSMDHHGGGGNKQHSSGSNASSTASSASSSLSNSHQSKAQPMNTVLNNSNIAKMEGKLKLDRQVKKKFIF